MDSHVQGTESSLRSLKSITLRLLNYCQTNNWAGYDPYDALNSRIIERLFIFNSRLPRLALTQMLKRSPINLRPLLMVPKTQNPKAMALFLSALLKLSKLGLIEGQDLTGALVDRLDALRTEDFPYSCWGYNFPWQMRTDIVAKGTPNLVCTVFVANSLLNAYEYNREPRCLSMAVVAAEYILNKLYWTHDGPPAGFSYPLPSIKTHIYNANLLGAALLCRVHYCTGEKMFLGPALKVARFSVSRQNEDGSWYYGESPKQLWIDNFHTGYNLLALRDINMYAETTEFESSIRRGFDFFLQRFFREDGAPRYYYDRTYPIDIHCVAQSLITLLALRDLNDRCVPLSRSVLKWATTHMWDERGYFYYQANRLYSNKISYMRWSQAWMLLALATFLEEFSNNG
jgi:hypothetical protein